MSMNLDMYCKAGTKLTKSGNCYSVLYYNIGLQHTWVNAACLLEEDTSGGNRAKEYFSVTSNVISLIQSPVGQKVQKPFFCYSMGLQHG
jgi:hypothetical protein